ncbi:hypothetical protein [Roseicyclus persicicus]|uniref:Uncharacterized protein n=1 Tax=Roseicyclus persicicus TaxID=2650661 RepID=A0A7X6GYW6_9RHOB|nr:hypothetical protein [Roseibacterium persicicum]NKX44946.1 hypothetical protein [Roseibacterium persicicum]
MQDETLTRVRLRGGRYEGLLSAAAGTGLEAVHEGRVVAVATLTADAARPEEQRVTLELPAEVIAEGVQVIGLRSTASGAVLDRVTLMAGEALDADIRAEVALLREELEMLKRAFRRHCAETAGR